MDLPLLTLIAVCALAWANGANDVSRGVATVAGSALASYRRALCWGSVWTAAGGGVALFVSAGLIATFSTALIAEALAAAPAFPLAVAAGACGWVLLAARLGLPVSTTHAMVGAIVGTALAAGGPQGVHWTLLAGIVALPLVCSPILSGVLAYAVRASAGPPLERAGRYCICVGERRIALAPKSAAAGAGTAAATAVAAIEIPTVVAGRQERCDPEAVTRRIPVTDAVHWCTSALLSFARGMNDTPKIVGPGVLAASAAGVGLPAVLLAVATLMGIGGYLHGRRVTVTLGERITDLDRLEGLAGNAVAAGLVLLASLFALPVSTTHVATGAIIGSGLHDGVHAIRWHLVGTIATAWLVTLPVAGLIAAAVWILAN